MIRSDVFAHCRCDKKLLLTFLEIYLPMRYLLTTQLMNHIYAGDKVSDFQMYAAHALCLFILL